MTGGGLELRSLDLARIARMVLARGVWEGEQLVPAKFVEQALTVNQTVNEDQDYGYLFWRRDFNTRCGSAGGWYMAGNGGNAIVMFRDLNAVIVVTRTRYNTPGMHQETIRLIEDHALPAIMCSQEPD
jgi:CubicO group peptidase (beta-lactamase class C family)